MSDPDALINHALLAADEIEHLRIENKLQAKVIELVQQHRPGGPPWQEFDKLIIAIEDIHKNGG